VEDIFSVEVLRAQGTLFFHQEKSFQDHCRDNAPSCGRVGVLQRMGTPADTADAGQPPFIPDLSQILAAGQRHGTRFFPDFSWPETPEG
jgi:hypothetical protein